VTARVTAETQRDYPVSPATGRYLAGPFEGCPKRLAALDRVLGIAFFATLPAILVSTRFYDRMIEACLCYAAVTFFLTRILLRSAGTQFFARVIVQAALLIMVECILVRLSEFKDWRAFVIHVPLPTVLLLMDANRANRGLDRSALFPRAFQCVSASPIAWFVIGLWVELCVPWRYAYLSQSVVPTLLMFSACVWSIKSLTELRLAVDACFGGSVITFALMPFMSADSVPPEFVTAGLFSAFFGWRFNPASKNRAGYLLGALLIAAMTAWAWHRTAYIPRIRYSNILSAFVGSFAVLASLAWLTVEVHRKQPRGVLRRTTAILAVGGLILFLQQFSAYTLTEAWRWIWIALGIYGAYLWLAAQNLVLVRDVRPAT
jgi:hypothetical protein